MHDRAVVWWGILFLLLSTLACNAFAGRVDSLPPPPVPTALPAPSALPSQPGLAPTATLPGEPTPGESQGIVRILVDLNIRSGPGVRYGRVGFLLRDEHAVVIGRDDQSGWWKIQCPPASEAAECWISGGSQFTLLESRD